MKEQKKKNAERLSKAPTPPVKPARHQDKPQSDPLSQPEKPQPKPRSQQDPSIPKPRTQQDPPKPKLRTQHDPPQPKPRFQPEPPQPKPLTKQEPPQPKPRSQQEPPQPKPRSDLSSTRNRELINQREDMGRNDNDLQQQKRQYQQQDQTGNDEEEAYEQEQRLSQQHRTQNQINDIRSSGRTSTQQQQSQMDDQNSKHDADRMINIRSKVSDNMGSTAARAQIKRKPLNKSLMDQVSNQMAVAKQQRESEQDEVRSSSPQSSVISGPTHKKTNSDGSLESLLKTFEVINPVNYSPPIAAVSDEAKFRRQPSEYKPDTGSIPTRRGVYSTTRVLQEIHDSPPSPTRSNDSMQDQFIHPVAPPKSPRPPPQQIDIQQQSDDSRNQNYQQNAQIPGKTHNQIPVQQQLQQQQYPSSPNMMMQQIPDQSSMYSHPQQQKHHYSSQPQYMGQQHMGQPQQYMGQTQQQMGQQQRSPMMQPQRSPMMQPQRSPMMQPQRSPMIQPQRSPMMQPQRSPMMTPMAQPQQNFGTQRGGLPPPITIPTNYGVTPQPSPAMTYANGGGVSPGGVLPPPAVPYHQPSQQLRPGQYSDGRPVLFWGK